MPDFRGVTSFAKAEGRDLEVEAERADWRSRARAFLRQEAVELQPKRPRYREKSCEWLLAVDNSLRVATGVGLHHFVKPDSEAPQGQQASPLAWPHLLMSPDQGSDGIAALNFLQRCKAVNIEAFWDMSHGVWRDWNLNVKHLGLWGHVLLMTIVLNMPYGPWENARWYEELRGAAKEFFSMDVETDPLFLSLMPAILRDRGESDRTLGDGVETELAQEVQSDEYLWKKGDKVGLCRFFGYIHCSRAFDKQHHSKLMTLLYLGLQLNLVTEASMRKVGDVVAAGSAGVSGADPAKEFGTKAMTRGNDEVNRLRQACKNTIHLAMTFLANPMTQTIQRVLIKSVEPIEQWHSEQSRNLRSCSANCTWLYEFVRGDCKAALVATLDLLLDDSSLEYVGLTTTCSVGQLRLPKNHPLILMEGKIASLFADSCLGMVGQRLKRIMWMHFWPTRGCLLGSTSVSTVAPTDLARATFELLRSDKQAFDAAALQRSTFWRNAIKRSFFNSPPVQQMVVIGEKAGWNLNPEVQDFFKQKYSGILASKLVEDGFLRERRQEDKGTNRPAYTCRYLWRRHLLISCQLDQSAKQYKTARRSWILTFASIRTPTTLTSISCNVSLLCCMAQQRLCMRSCVLALSIETVCC